MPFVGMGVTLLGVDFPEWGITTYLNTATTKDHLGVAMAVDTSAPNTMKPAADGDLLRGILYTFEDRKQEGVKVGTIRMKGGFKLPIATGQTVTVGQSVVGAGDGKVKPSATPLPGNFVAEVEPGFATVFFV